MDDPFKRASLTFMGLSLGVFMIAYAMTADGAAVGSNPAWQLVSFLRNIFIYLWVLLLAGAVIGGVAMAIFTIREAILDRERTRLEAERIKALRIANEEKRALETLRRENEEKIANEEALAREIKRQREIDLELEKRRRRSSEQAIDEALNDF